MWRTISLVRGTLSWLSGGAIVVALVVLLHSQFRERFPTWEGSVLVWAVLAWWVCTLPLKMIRNLHTGNGTRHRRGRDAAIALYLFAWGVQGALVVAAVARYVAGASQQPRFEAVLAALAVALIIATLTKRAAMRWAGADVAVLRSGFAVVRWVAAIGLAGFAQPLGVLLAKSVYQPPVWFYAWFDSWAWSAVGLVGATLASAVYLYILGRITGIIQAFSTERFSTTHTHEYGGMIQEYTDNHDYRVPRSRTGLRAVARLGRVTDQMSTSQTTGSGSGSFSGGYGYFSFDSTTYTTTYERVHLVQFPPEYFPGWLTWLAARLPLGRTKPRGLS
jgi:hypothetical protein